LQLQSSNLEVDTFQHHASDLIAPDLLSLTWTSRLLDSFSLCLEQVSGVQRMALEAASEDDDVLLLGEKWCRILFFFFP
jgi:hypothetical protein